MNQLAVIDRGAAARKAWETRRSRGVETTPVAHLFRTPTKRAEADAIAAFEREANSEAPDWHKVALQLKRALSAKHPPIVRQLVHKALPPPVWPDYPVDRAQTGKLQWPSPMLVVTFADGEIVRAPAVSLAGKPVNIGRGLRVAISFYQFRRLRRAGVQFKRGRWPNTPEVKSCVCEDTGETYDSKQCNLRTIEDRKARGWKRQRKHVG